VSNWQTIAATNAGQLVTLTVRATDPTKSGTVYEAPGVPIRFSKSAVPGALYYWSTTVKGVRRGRLADPAPTNFLTPAEADTKCVACHTLSRNGQRLAADVGGENLWVVDVTPAVPPPRRITSYQNKAIPNAWATFNPDASRVVTAKDGLLILRDGNTGAPVGSMTGAIAVGQNQLATMPDWAPDGKHLVFATGPNAKGRKAINASIAQLSASGDTFSTLEVIVQTTGMSDSNSWPMFDPTSTWIAFVKSAASSEKDPTAQLHVIAAKPGGTPQALTRANTLVNDTMLATGLFNNMPTWAPTSSDGIEWVAFTSTRDYGFVLADRSTYGSEKRQLWIAGIDMSKLGTQDPSFPAFRVPFQELTENAHRPFWAEDALVPEPDGGPPVTPPDAGGACIAENGDCASGDCCLGLVCSDANNRYVCVPNIVK
jgi:hypothetical protein